MVTMTTPLPPAPQRGDGREDFSDDADVFAEALTLFQAQLNQQAEDLNNLALAVQAAMQTALNAPGTSAASTTSLTIGTGMQTLTIQTGKALAVGQWVEIAATANPANQMIGYIWSYDAGAGALTVAVVSALGSGTFAGWTVALTAPLPLATKADILAGSAGGRLVTPKALLDAAAPAALAFAATVTPDLSQAWNFDLTVTGNFALANPVNAPVGASGRIRITIGGSGGYTWTVGSKYDPFPGSTPSLPTTVGAVALLQYYVRDANTVEYSLVRK